LNSKHCLVISLTLLISFLALAAVVSPRINGSNTPIINADASAFLYVNESHYKSLDQLMILMTNYGREVIWTAAGILIFIFGGWTGKKTSIVMALAMIVLIPIGALAKEAIGRPRPLIPDKDFLIAADTDFAFPSGHAVIVSAGAATVLVLFRGSYRKLAVSISLAVEAALVCFSRVYVGGHYPLDVIGGMLLGAGVAFAFIAAAKRIDQLLQPIAKALKR